MVLLGSIAGSGAGIAFALFWLHGNFAWCAIIPFTAVAFVFFPLMAWQGQRPYRFFTALYAAMIACAVHLGSFWLADGFDSQLVTVVFAGAVGGFAYGAAGLNLLGGTQLRTVLQSTAISAAVHFFTATVVLHPWFMSKSFGNGLDELIEINLATGLFSGMFMGVGISLGQFIWDNTPRPRYEPPAPPT
jgi:hypothetical protein